MIKKILLSCALISSIVSGYAIADGFPRMHPKSEDNTATIQTDQSYSLNKIVAIASTNPGQ